MNITRFKSAWRLLVISTISFSSVAKAVEPEELWFKDLSNEELLLTPTRMGQTKDDVPATVTSLTREELLLKGITSIPEALRLVPGMFVFETAAYSQGTGRDYRISYHGGPSLANRRMQVLIDGMSMYMGSVSMVNWTQLPVIVEDIERIEVTRSPSSAAYGSNSFSAVVNIITRHPQDVPRTEFAVNADSRKNTLASGRTSLKIGSSNLLLKYSSSKNNGYDNASSIEYPDFVPDESHDDYKVQRLILKTATQLSDKAELMIDMGLVDGEYDSEYVTPTQINLPTHQLKDRFVNTELNYTHNAQAHSEFRLSWKEADNVNDYRACSPYIYLTDEARALAVENRTYFDALVAGQTPSGGSQSDDLLALGLLSKVGELTLEGAFSEVCGTLNQNFTDERYQAEYELYYEHSETLRSVYGVGAEYAKNTSETYFNGAADRELYNVFFSTEWKPITALTLNAGAMTERPSNTHEALVSPRFSVNWHLPFDSTVRLIASRGYRNPELSETDRNWNYFVRDLEPLVEGLADTYYALNADATDFNIKHERVDMVELGYLFNPHDSALSADIRVYQKELTDVIEEVPNFAAFSLRNAGDATVKGAEFSIKQRFGKKLSLDLNYAYLDYDSEVDNELVVSPRHSGNAYLTYVTNDWSVSFGYIGFSQYAYDLWTANARKRFDLTRQSSLDLSIGIQYQPNDVRFGLTDREGDISYSYDDDTAANASIAYVF